MKWENNTNKNAIGSKPEELFKIFYEIKLLRKKYDFVIDEVAVMIYKVEKIWH